MIIKTQAQSDARRLSPAVKDNTNQVKNTILILKCKKVVIIPLDIDVAINP